MHFESIVKKIVSLDQLLPIVEKLKGQNKSVVFTNGCFDIIHRGHIEYLAKASDHGDLFVIGLNTDNSVRKLKGESRPVNSEEARAIVLASIQFVDYVVLFEEETPYNLIQAIKPNVLIKGGDYKPENIVGYDIVIKNGGRVETIPFVEGFSTTSILHKISTSK